MLRFIRTAILVVIASVLGAVLGRVVLEARRKQEVGEDPTAIDPRSITLRVQDLVPGIVAAFRVRDRPWTWLRIPSWLAAFAVNFAVAAVGGDLSKVRETVERAAFNMAGIQMPGDPPDVSDSWSPPPPPPAPASRWTTAEPDSPASGAPTEEPPGVSGFRDQP